MNKLYRAFQNILLSVGVPGKSRNVLKFSDVQNTYESLNNLISRWEEDCKQVFGRVGRDGRFGLPSTECRRGFKSMSGAMEIFDKKLSVLSQKFNNMPIWALNMWKERKVRMETVCTLEDEHHWGFVVTTERECLPGSATMFRLNEKALILKRSEQESSASLPSRKRRYPRKNRESLIPPKHFEITEEFFKPRVELYDKMREFRDKYGSNISLKRVRNYQKGNPNRAPISDLGDNGSCDKIEVVSRQTDFLEVGAWLNILSAAESCLGQVVDFSGDSLTLVPLVASESDGDDLFSKGSDIKFS